MPRYAFQCLSCGYEFEVQLPYASKELPLCTQCRGVTQKIIRPPKVHFKGGGFYTTDSSKKPVVASAPKLETETKPAATEAAKTAEATKPASEAPAKREPKKADSV